MVYDRHKHLGGSSFLMETFIKSNLINEFQQESVETTENNNNSTSSSIIKINKMSKNFYSKIIPKKFQKFNSNNNEKIKNLTTFNNNIYLIVLFGLLCISPISYCDRKIINSNFNFLPPTTNYANNQRYYSMKSSMARSVDTAHQYSQINPANSPSINPPNLMALNLYPPIQMMSPYISSPSQQQKRYQDYYKRRINNNVRVQECDIETDPVIEILLEKMGRHLPEEKISIQNGAMSIYDARIHRFAELSPTKPSCARKLDPDGVLLLIPFEAEIRSAQVVAKLRYDFFISDLYGDYTANFSHIRLNGTLETNWEEEWMRLSEFTITSSKVIDDNIMFGIIPRWVLDLVRSFMSSDNTEMYERLARAIVKREVENFNNYDLIRRAAQPSIRAELREEEEEKGDVAPSNLL